MRRRLFLIVVLIPLLWCPMLQAAERSPNIVLILADDLGCYELGCYGQKKIKTPNIDNLAASGMKFDQFYAGNAVCAPSRCCLMTGKHSGHAFVRDNREVKPEGQAPLPASEITLAEVLKAKGYVTAAAGKWGLGPWGSEGDPLAQGFDHFYGYNCQRHAHSHYPTFIYRDGKKVELEGNDGVKGTQFTQDLFEAEALSFIKDNKDRPFFLYLPFIVPHVALQVPEDSLKEYLGLWEDPPYKGGKGYQPHESPRAAYAAMITRLDRGVGRLVERLKELKIDDNTLVIFTSDNGPTHGGVGGSDSEFFASAGSLRGLKGSLYEGGIRVPFLVSWPGKIKAGTTGDLPLAFWDVLPTLVDLAGAEVPKGCDGLSFLPTLLGKDGQRKHEFLYWEFPGYGGQQAVRAESWKAVRQELNKGKKDIQLYDLKADPGEKKDLAKDHPEIVSRLEKVMKEQHQKSETFPQKVLDLVGQ